MPPHHHDHHHPPHHFWFEPIDEARLTAASDEGFGRVASRVLNEHGAPPEQRILIELVLCLSDRLQALELLVGEDRDARSGKSISSSPGGSTSDGKRRGSKSSRKAS